MIECQFDNADPCQANSVGYAVFEAWEAAFSLTQSIKRCSLSGAPWANRNCIQPSIPDTRSSIPPMVAVRAEPAVPADVRCLSKVRSTCRIQDRFEAIIHLRRLSADSEIVRQDLRLGSRRGCDSKNCRIFSTSGSVSRRRLIDCRLWSSLRVSKALSYK